ncbi:MAG: MBL fold metallo-hydrolase [Candidatus Hodarchaeaceae archaeon]|nr:MBL fold metallo-hydrolase [Candidatus Hodarchaeaceae archaeon]
MGKLTFEPVWFDSLGAKSSCTLVRTPDVSVLIDPGVAVMQPSFPASWAKKLYWVAQGMRAIRQASRKADVVVISHYHYDHFTDFDRGLYEGKLLLTKNPNEFINDSQRERAEHFFDNISRAFGNVSLEKVLQKRQKQVYDNPLEDIPHARDKDFCDYNRRRRELFRKGHKWFRNRVNNWNSAKWIPELKFDDIEVKFPEGKKFKFGRTKLRFTPPMFHGIEFSRVGWVFATVIEYGKEKLIHSSDMDGPIIEDYADWIIRENPGTLILDGPPSYMFGYLTTRTTMNRAVANAVRILRKSDVKLMIYDHHLPREPKFKEWTREVWDEGKRRGKKVLTAAEFLGKKPVVLNVGISKF